MNHFSTATLLSLHAGVIAAILAGCYFFLNRQRLFNWTSAGFWAWTAFMLYFVISPYSAVLSGDTGVYDMRLSISGGPDRALWILCVAAVGIIVFFFTYLRTAYKPVHWGLSVPSYVFTPRVVAIMGVFILIGLYSLLAFRAGLIEYSGEKLIEGGRFTGGVTGYSNVAHKFIFVPMFLFMLSGKPLLRGSGWGLAAIYFILSLPHEWSRYITVSLFVAFSIYYCLGRRRRWPKALYVAVILLVVGMLQIRGHVKWEWGSIMKSATESIARIPEKGLDIVGGSSDSAMLASWYVKSWLVDEYIGYDYGLPFINYLLFGWIPNRFFPDKYFLVDWLQSIKGQSLPFFYDEQILYGAKYTLLGSFYGHGGIVGVVLCMAGAGFLCRRLDGMLDPASPILVKAVAIGWFSTLWMDWGSGDSWVLMNWGSLAIPGIVLWFFWRKRAVQKQKPGFHFQKKEFVHE